MPVKEVIETGKTVDVAIDLACEKLGCRREDCEWEIIDLPKKGFLGLKNIPAKVRVSVEIPDSEPKQINLAEAVQPAGGISDKNSLPVRERQPEKQPKQNEQKAAEDAPPRARPEISATRNTKGNYVVNPEKTEISKAYILSIIQEMGLTADLVVREEEGGICINIEGKGLGTIIGRRGETLDALQYLTSLVANRIDGDYMRITIDCGDYRTKRQETLQALAKKLASQVLKTNVNKTLEPMNPFERRIIHATVSEIEGVSSISVGEEPNRRVMITSPTARSRSGSGRQGSDRNRRGGSSFSGGQRRGGPPGPGGKRRDGGGFRSQEARPERRDQPADAGPPKQTPESAVSTDKPLYTKIDLD